jgi:sterol desaturase/sphingolipid hydroxylase (fatty acid hydroxylase superfamily)
MYAISTSPTGRCSTATWLVRRASSTAFSTPGVHRWHHSIDGAVGNHNYGAVLSIWDLVFGTYLDRPRLAGPVGIADLPAFPTRYLAQLASPFRWQRITAMKAT